MRKTTCYIQRMNLDLYYPPHIKINLKWIKYLNVRPEIANFYTKTQGKKIFDIGLDNDFCVRRQKHRDKN